MSDQQDEFFTAGDLEAYPYITSRLWKPGHVGSDSRILSKSLEWISTLEGGEGAHGRVYRVRKRDAGGIHQIFACKVIRQGRETLWEDIVAEMRAIDKICHAEHQNVVKVLRHWCECWDDVPTYLVQMELCDSDLDTFLKQQQDIGYLLTYSEVSQIGRSITAGLEFIHSLDEVHRDLKPKNVLLKIESGEKVWKIADFGFTTSGGSDKLLKSEKGRMTRLYCAPELLLRGEFNKKLDIWAFGCILFEIVTGTRAFPSQTSIQSYYWSSGDRDLPQIPPSRAGSLDNQRNALNHILKSTLHRDPMCRPGAAQLSLSMTGAQCKVTNFNVTGVEKREAIRKLPRLVPAKNSKAPIIPHPRNPHFTGRVDLLDQIYDHLKPDDARGYTASIALCGLGGVGKSQVAIEFSYRHSGEYPLIFWFRASSRDQLLRDYGNIARYLVDHSRSGSEPFVVAQVVKSWFENEEGNWLLIYDNLENVSQVHDLVPCGKSGSILFTSRDQSAIGTISDDTLEVLPMSSQIAEHFLLRTIRKERSASELEKEQASKLVADLGCLPLAIEQAGGYIRATGSSIAEFSVILSKDSATLLQKKAPYQLQVRYYTNTVWSTWNITFKELEKRNKLATDILSSISYLDPYYIHDEILRSLCGREFSEDNIQQAVDVLQQFSIVRRLQNGEIWVHQLVQTVIQGMVEQKGKAEACIRNVGHAISPYFPPCIEIRHNSSQHVLRFSQDSIPEIKYNVAHAMKCTEGMMRYSIGSKEIGRIAWAASEQLFDLGLYERAEAVVESILSLCVSGDSDENACERTIVICRLGTLKLWLRKFEEATRLNKEAVALARSNFGDRSLEFAQAQHYLGFTYVQLGVPEKAVQLLQEAFNRKKEILGEEHRGTASTAWVIGDMYQSLGWNEKAEEAFMFCFEVRSRVLGAESDGALDAALRLVNVYQLQDKLMDAETLLVQISQQEMDFQDQNGEQKPLPDRLHLLSDAYWNCRKFGQAISIAEKVLEIHMTTLGTDNWRTAETMLNLARLYNEIGDLERMEEMYECALTAFQNIIEREWQVNRVPYEQFSFYPAFCGLCKKFFAGLRYVCRGCYNLPDGYSLCGDCFRTRKNEHNPLHEFLRIPRENWQQSFSS